MKKSILIFIVTFLMVLTGCNQATDIKDDILSEDTKSDVLQSAYVWWNWRE